jgi:hypothetical protein
MADVKLADVRTVVLNGYFEKIRGDRLQFIVLFWH